MTDEIIRLLLEADDEPDWKDTAHTFRDTSWPETYHEVHYLYDENGHPVKKSRNLRGIRQYVSSMPVRTIRIQQLDKGEGGIRVDFDNNWYWLGRFASFGVLKWALKGWRNLYGAPLYVNGELSGKVDYRNPVLQEADEGDFDVKEVVGGEGVYSLDDMKAAEPEFFSRRNNEWFGTKKIYKYGNYLVLKNVRRTHGHFGQMNTWTQFVIYEFVKTHDTPQGLMLHRQNANSLAVAKSMIKRQDFREWREQLADYGTGLWRLESLEDDDESTKELLGGNLGLGPLIKLELAKGTWREAGSHHFVFKINAHMNLLVTQLDDDLWELRTTFDEIEMNRMTGTEQEILAILEREGYLEGGGMFNREVEYQARTGQA